MEPGEKVSTRSIASALAMALAAAANDRRWDVVAQLARELEARRLAGDRRVVTLPSTRVAWKGGWR
jgi:hypothetical protein